MAEQVQTLPARIRTLSAAELFDGDPEAVERVIAEVETAARSVVRDVGTAAARRATASLAHKVARSKTFLDGLGKDHVAELKRRAGAVDAKRRVIRERLDALAAEVRAPLAACGQAEAERQAAIRARIDALKLAPPDDPFTDGAAVEARIAEVEAVVIDASFAEQQEEAATVKDAALHRLHDLLALVRDREAEQSAAAELARERAERVEAERTAAAATRRAVAAPAAGPGSGEREHQVRINREVLADLCDCELAGRRLAEPEARALIAAIARGRIAHVAIAY